MLVNCHCHTYQKKKSSALSISKHQILCSFIICPMNHNLFTCQIEPPPPPPFPKFYYAFSWNFTYNMVRLWRHMGSERYIWFIMLELIRYLSECKVEMLCHHYLETLSFISRRQNLKIKDHRVYLFSVRCLSALTSILLLQVLMVSWEVKEAPTAH